MRPFVWAHLLVSSGRSLACSLLLLLPLLDPQRVGRSSKLGPFVKGAFRMRQAACALSSGIGPARKLALYSANLAALSLSLCLSRCARARLHLDWVWCARALEPPVVRKPAASSASSAEFAIRATHKTSKPTAAEHTVSSDANVCPNHLAQQQRQHWQERSEELLD